MVIVTGRTRSAFFCCYVFEALFVVFTLVLGASSALREKSTYFKNLSTAEKNRWTCRVPKIGCLSVTLWSDDVAYHDLGGSRQRRSK